MKCPYCGIYHSDKKWMAEEHMPVCKGQGILLDEKERGKFQKRIPPISKTNIFRDVSKALFKNKRR